MHRRPHHTECDFDRGLVIDTIQSCDDERDCHRPRCARTAIFCIATLSAGHIGRLGCQFKPVALKYVWQYMRMHACGHWGAWCACNTSSQDWDYLLTR